MSDTGQGNQQRPQTDCIICLELADEALVTACCINVICKQCHDKLPSNECPNCRKKDFKVNVELYIRKFIQEVSPQIQFFVKTLTGSTFSLRMKELDTVEMLFNRVQQRQKIEIANMRFTIGTKGISTPSKQSLKKCKITPNMTIHLLGRLLGGQLQ